MRKGVLLFIFLVSSHIGIYTTQAAWYGSHPVPYVASGITECNDDGDTTGGSPSFSNSPLAGSSFKDHRASPVGNTVASGNMTCEFWDGSVPTGGSLVNTFLWVNTAQPVTFGGFSDAGGSKLDHIDLYEMSRTWTDNVPTPGAWGSWTKVDAITGINSNISGSKTYTRSFTNRTEYYYKTIAYDIAGNISSDVTNDNTIQMENEAPTGSLTYTNGWTNISAQTVSFTINDTGGSQLKEYRLEQSTSVDSPGFTTWGAWTLAKTGLSIDNNSKIDSYTYTASNNTAYKYRLVIDDNAGNTFTKTSTNITSIDTTAPIASDISGTTPASLSNLLATDSQNFSLSVGVNQGSPIVKIEGYFEDYTTVNAFLGTMESSTNGILNFNRSIQNVDLDRSTNGGRNYSFIVTKITDQAGNTTSISGPGGIKSFNYNVFADTLNITTKQVGSHDLANGQTADGQIQSMPISLADTYGNQVIPATGIDRKIDFKFDTDNGLYLDQYNRTGIRSVFASIPFTPNSYTNRFAIGNGQTTSFMDQSSSDGTYPFSFKIYTPTYQNYKADPNGKFKINSIHFDVNGLLGPKFNQLIANSLIDFNFKPLYQTAITGDLRDGGFIEGARQDSTLTVAKNTSSISGIDPIVQLKFDGTDANKFKFYGGTTIGSINTNQINTLPSIVNAITFPTSTNSLFTKLVQNPGVIGNSLNTYLSTHISYQLPDPSGNSTNLNILYNSDILGKSNYFGTTNTELTKQNGIKITGITSTQKSQELVTNQFSKDVKLLGNSSKFNNKTEIIKNATTFARNIVPNNNTNTISRLDGNNLSGKELSNILYFGNLHGANVTVASTSDIGITGKRTILITGGNLYIKSNLYYTNNSSILGIIVMKDSAGRGGNIYIDPNVTNIAGTLFAEKSVISYNGTELDGNTPISTLKNQLLIYGNIFSENTMGGSRKSPAQCPYYVGGTCSTTIAQKYDLNYLRRYYLVNNIYPYGNGAVIGGGRCNNTSTCGPHNPNLSQTKIFTSTSNIYASYPVIIDYNADLQKNPPPLFSLK